MNHLALEHIQKGETLKRSRPDFGLFQHLWMKRLINDQDLKELKGGNHNLSKPPMQYHPVTVNIRGHRDGRRRRTQHVGRRQNTDSSVPLRPDPSESTIDISKSANESIPLIVGDTTIDKIHTYDESVDKRIIEVKSEITDGNNKAPSDPSGQAQTPHLSQKCKTCDKVERRQRRRAAEIERISRWQREGNKFRASIDKATVTVASIDAEIQNLKHENHICPIEAIHTSGLHSLQLADVNDLCHVKDVAGTSVEPETDKGSFDIAALTNEWNQFNEEDKLPEAQLKFDNTSYCQGSDQSAFSAIYGQDDSGYGSRSDGILKNALDNDAASVSSVITNAERVVLPTEERQHVIQAFVSDLCQDLGFRGYSTVERERIFAKLPDLIKSFAMRLDGAPSFKVQCQAKDFVRQQRK